MIIISIIVTIIIIVVFEVVMNILNARGSDLLGEWLERERREKPGKVE